MLDLVDISTKNRDNGLMDDFLLDRLNIGEGTHPHATPWLIYEGQSYVQYGLGLWRVENIAHQAHWYQRGWKNMDVSTALIVSTILRDRDLLSHEPKGDDLLYYLYWYKGFSFQRIVETTGISKSPNTVRSIFNRRGWPTRRRGVTGGNKHGKLSNHQLERILFDLVERVPQKQIAEKYSISQQRVSQIAKGNHRCVYGV